MNQENLTIGKFLFIMDWPTEVLEAVKPLATELEWFLPPWCHIVVVCWKPNIKAAMTCSAEYDYRRIRISLGPSWLDESHYDRVSCLLHELVHGFSLPMVDYMDKFAERMLPGDEHKNYRESVQEAIRERNEGFTEDITFALMKKLCLTNIIEINSSSKARFEEKTEPKSSPSSAE